MLPNTHASATKLLPALLLAVGLLQPLSADAQQKGGAPVLKRLWPCGGPAASDCTRAGLRYEKGEGVERDEARAVSLFEQGCERGDATGCLGRGRLAKAPAEARPFYKKSCDLGLKEGCIGYLQLPLASAEPPAAEAPVSAQDVKQRMRRLGLKTGPRGEDGGQVAKAAPAAPSEDKVARATRECEAGKMFHCMLLGTYYVDGKSAELDPERAARFFRKACDGGDMRGCGLLGALLLRGMGAPQDVRGGMALLERSCTERDGESCKALARAYWQGMSGEYDPALEYEYQEKACVLGAKKACERFESAEIEVEVEEARAREGLARTAARYQQECEGGNARSCMRLGAFFHATGLGVAKDGARAVALLDRACQGGDMTGCGRLGEFYALGKFVQVDVERALHLLNRSCQGRSAYGCAVIAFIELELGKEDPVRRDKSLRLLDKSCRMGDARACARMPRYSK